MSIAGGYYKAVERAAEVGCEVVQVFTKNNNQWRAKPITDEEAARFRAALDEHGIGHPIAHASYLINLASPVDELWRKSIDAMIVELQRAEQLGLGYVVVHPGSYTTSSEEKGLARVAAALDEVHRQTPSISACCLLENTAGQGSNLGFRFEHLAAILDRLLEPERVGVCCDTCHLFAAGYPLSTEQAYRETMKTIDATVGIAQVRAFHLNDSKTPLGSRVDRHAHIGEGEMGLAPFRHLLGDRRFRNTPMYLETPKGTRDGESLDTFNLQTLRKLLAASKQRPGGKQPPVKKQARRKK